MKQVVALEKKDMQSLLAGLRLVITVNGQPIYIESEVHRRGSKQSWTDLTKPKGKHKKVPFVGTGRGRK